MTAVNRLTLGGFPIILDGPVGWRLRPGCSSDPMVFNLAPGDAAALLRVPGPTLPTTADGTARPKKLVTVGGGGPEPVGAGEHGIALVFERPNGERHEFRRLYVSGESRPPTALSHDMRSGSLARRAVMVVDQRYFWKHNHIVARYNLARVSGNRRVVSPAGTPAAIRQVVDDVAFAPLSLRNRKTPWTALEVVEDILNRVVGLRGADWEIRGKPTALLPVQDIEINDPGNVAVAKVVSLLTGYDVFQAPDGRIIVASGLPGTADSLIEGLGAPLVIGQRIERVDQACKRGAEFISLTTRELGVRFDYVESAANGTTSVANLNPDDPWIVNVFRTTDVVTNLNSGPVPPGCFIPRETLLPKWQEYAASLGGKIASVVTKDPITTTNILRFYLSHLSNVWARLGDEGGDPSVVLNAYINEILKSFRKTFIVNPAYSGGALRFIAKDPGLIDPETGAERAAPVFVDHAIKPSRLAVFKDRNTRFYLYNRRDGTAVAVPGTPTAKASPFTLRVLNEQLGIFEIEPHVDPTGLEERIIPSAILNSSIPRADHSAAIAQRSIDVAKLDPDHKMSVIVTIVPGLPNDDRQYHRIAVSKADVEKVLGLPLGPCLAPPFEQLVGAGLATAKFPYDLNRAPEVKKALGILPGEPQLGDPVNQEDLKALAIATAAAHYITHLDHYAGSKTVPMRSDVEPVGEIEEVYHVMSVDGALFTTITCGIRNFDLIDPLALLPDSARRTLLRAVNPTGA